MRAPDLATNTLSSVHKVLRSRVAARLAICLILGAIINVTVAWTIVLVPQDEQKSTEDYGQTNNWPAPAPSDWPAPVLFDDWTQIGFRGLVVQGGPLRGAGGDHGYPGYRSHYMIAIQTGWPRLSMVAWKRRWTHPSRIDKAWSMGIEVFHRRPEPLYAGNLPIPLLPIPLGFMLNTLFYAAILFTLRAAHTMTRRALRVRRGRCPACGYDASDLPRCPECGHTPQTTASAIAPT